MKIGALLGGALLVTVLPVDAGGKLAMRVSPSVSYEPASVTIQLSVEPDAGNRALAVVAESTEYFRSSQVELDGRRAPRTSVFQYRGLPAGEYFVRGALLGSRGETLATVSHNVRVVGKGLR